MGYLINTMSGWAVTVAEGSDILSKVPLEYSQVKGAVYIQFLKDIPC